MSLSVVTWGITIVFCTIFLYISWRVKDQASSSFSAYAIAGGTLPLILVLFTDIATIMGAGNFIGHAAHGFSKGLTHIPFIFGEQGSKIVFALAFAGLAGRFTYNTLSEMMEDLLHRDKVSRALVGLLTGAIMVAWVGGQGKGLGDIFAVFTGANPLPIILFFSAVFIVYTVLGGIYSVVWTDLLQGIIVVVFGVLFYYFALAPVHWSFAELGSRLAQVGARELWAMNIPFSQIANSFVTGCFGILAAQIYWQRSFAAKDGRTASTAMLISGVLVIVAVSMTAMVGMVAKAINPELNPAHAMPWLMMNYVPMWVTAMVFTLILAAAMSSADSCLNAAAITAVNDVIRPFLPHLSDRELVRYARILTVVIGVFAALAAIYATSIIGLFAKAYTMAGGGVVPVLLVGLVWKKDFRQVFTMGVQNSRLTPWGARVGLVLGAVISLTYGILWGVLVSTVATVLVSAVAPAMSAPGKEAA
jgi:SSS family solute:Na+ symporter